MSFPIFHLLAEVQIRGHFYWALKGTLSLGFNRPHFGLALAGSAPWPVSFSVHDGVPGQLLERYALSEDASYRDAEPLAVS